MSHFWPLLARSWLKKFKKKKNIRKQYFYWLVQQVRGLLVKQNWRKQHLFTAAKRQPGLINSKWIKCQYQASHEWINLNSALFFTPRPACAQLRSGHTSMSQSDDTGLWRSSAPCCCTLPPAPPTRRQQRQQQQLLLSPPGLPVLRGRVLQQ